MRKRLQKSHGSREARVAGAYVTLLVGKIGWGEERRSQDRRIQTSDDDFEWSVTEEIRLGLFKNLVLLDEINHCQQKRERMDK